MKKQHEEQEQRKHLTTNGGWLRQKETATMPKFIIYEERVEQYTCTIEAANLEKAKELYDQDPIEVFGDQWEQEETQGVELRQIIELDEQGNTKSWHIFENGELQDSIKMGEEVKP